MGRVYLFHRPTQPSQSCCTIYDFRSLHCDELAVTKLLWTSRERQGVWSPWQKMQMQGCPCTNPHVQARRHVAEHKDSLSCRSSTVIRGTGLFESARFVLVSKFSEGRDLHTRAKWFPPASKRWLVLGSSAVPCGATASKAIQTIRTTTQTDRTFARKLGRYVVLAWTQWN